MEEVTTKERTFWFRIEGPQGDLTFVGPDQKVNEQQVVVEAQLLARAWNRRYAARHCEGHEWRDEIEMNEEIFGPDVFDAFCVRCGTSRLEWEAQLREETLQ